MSSTTMSRRALRVEEERAPRHGSMLLRGALAVLLLAAAVLLVINLFAVSTIEARLVALWLGPLIDGGVVAVRDFFVVRLPDAPIAFQITPECSAVIILAPLLGIAALMMLSRRIRIARGVAGLLVGLAVVLLTNQIRLATIAWASQAWGMSVGYEVSHKFVGSVLGIIGFCLSVGVMFLVAARTRKRARRSVSATQSASRTET